MKKVKIIDLLNCIAQGKMPPKRIKCRLLTPAYRYFTYDEESEEYICDNDSRCFLSVPNHHLNDIVEVIEEPTTVITLPDLKEGQNVYVVDKNFGASKIKKLQIQSFTIRHGVLSVNLFAHGFNWAIRPEDLGKTAFLNIYDAQEKAKEV